MAKFCTSCGGALKPDSRFCNACGAPVKLPEAEGTAPVRAALAPRPISQTHRSTLMVAGVVLVVVVVLCRRIHALDEEERGRCGGSAS